MVLIERLQKMPHWVVLPVWLLIILPFGILGGIVRKIITGKE